MCCTMYAHIGSRPHHLFAGSTHCALKSKKPYMPYSTVCCMGTCVHSERESKTRPPLSSPLLTSLGKSGWGGVEVGRSLLTDGGREGGRKGRRRRRRCRCHFCLLRWMDGSKKKARGEKRPASGCAVQYV